MSYVKISDPAIMDLAGIQQIISVVNQHSDLLNVLINRFGTIITPDWDGDTTEGLYDVASTNIAFGKATVTDDELVEVNGKDIYLYTVQFSEGITFSKKPIILLTLDNTGGSQKNQADIIATLHGVTTSEFTIRVLRSGFYNEKYDIDNNVRINWIAIGPR